MLLVEFVGILVVFGEYFLEVDLQVFDLELFLLDFLLFLFDTLDGFEFLVLFVL